VAALVALSFVGCAAVDGVDDCDAIVDKLESCNVAVPTELPDDCADDPTRYNEVAALECQDLQLAFDDKADGIPGFKGEGDSCVLNFSCFWDLVCRPTEKIYRLPPLSHSGLDGEHQCANIAGEGEYCDSDGDCEDGLRCLKTGTTRHFACR